MTKWAKQSSFEPRTNLQWRPEKSQKTPLYNERSQLLQSEILRRKTKQEQGTDGSTSDPAALLRVKAQGASASRGPGLCLCWLLGGSNKQLGFGLVVFYFSVSDSILVWSMRPSARPQYKSLVSYKLDLITFFHLGKHVIQFWEIITDNMWV